MSFTNRGNKVETIDKKAFVANFETAISFVELFACFSCQNIVRGKRNESSLLAPSVLGGKLRLSYLASFFMRRPPVGYQAAATAADGQKMITHSDETKIALLTSSSSRNNLQHTGKWKTKKKLLPTQNLEAKKKSRKCFLRFARRLEN